MNQNQYSWWQKGVIYQIYPRSFQDSNSDGIGDIKGIIERLDYLSDTLEIDIVWLSPIYPSPMKDFGYDVSDYCDIHPIFGSLADFDLLLNEIHRRGMKIILDLVPNHTSDQHRWFLESRSSSNNPKRDWYIWRDPAEDGGAPNNWLSYFGGPAWTFDPLTNQYYLHQFVSQQPELNYRNPEVVAALHDIMRFWLDRGVDGFRVDVIWLMLKDPLFRDEPQNPKWNRINPFDSLEHIYTANLPEVHQLIQGMRKVLDSYDDRMMVGEIYLPNDALVTYYGSHEKPECHLPFNFQLIQTNWNPVVIRTMIENYEAALSENNWPNWVLGNHDQHRIATRLGIRQARVATLLLLTLRGTPTCYYGDELGMEDVPIPPELIQDPPAVNQPDIAHIVGRDPERTPMQWNDTPHAGFTHHQIAPWLPVSVNYQSVNVKKQLEDPESMLNFYRRIIQLRKQLPPLLFGSYKSIDNSCSQVFIYQRELGHQKIWVALNFSNREQQVLIDDKLFQLSNTYSFGQILLSTSLTYLRELNLKSFKLYPNEGCIIQIPKQLEETATH